LQGIAVDVLLRAAATRSLARLVDATGLRLAEMGEEEIDEGALRLAAADMAADRAAELGAAGLAASMAGVADLEIAADDAYLARGLAREGVAEVATGAAELGAAQTVADMADALAGEPP
jgi:hypothetical protein